MSQELYKPGLHKLIHQHKHLDKIENRQVTSPLHLSIWPTRKCQFKCSYCCFKNMPDDGNELSFENFTQAIDVLVKYGLKALEFAGGGEPTLWPYFYDGASYAKEKGLKISLVTNGLLLDSIDKSILSKLEWIRVSLQSISHANQVNFKYIPESTRVSASLIVDTENKLSSLGEFKSFAESAGIIIRATPQKPCTITWIEEVKTAVTSAGYPLLFFDKTIGKQTSCYMAYLRAAIDWRSNFLPCPSIELAEENSGYVPDDFILCKIAHLENWLIENPPHDLGFRCDYCNCGAEMNNYVDGLLKGIEDAEFI